MTEQLRRKPLGLSSPPQSYQASEAIRTCLSLAYSTFHNPRGLESSWYACWTQTFSELTAPYDGDIIVQPQYPLYISSVYVKERQLRHAFAVNGLVYDSNETDNDAEDTDSDSSDLDGDDDCISSKSNSEDERRNTKNDPDFDISQLLTSSPPRQRAPSKRLVVRHAQREVHPIQQDTALVDSLQAQKKKLLTLKKQFTERADGDISIASIASQHDGGAIDWAPDYVLSHVPTLELPDSQKSTQYYKHRAGLKVFHHCCAIIAEIKRGRSRGISTVTNTKEVLQGRHSANRYSEAARLQLAAYCAAYFQITPTAKSVIALAAAGAEWHWAVIQREDLPKFNWKTKGSLNMKDRQLDHFLSKFGDQLFTLGTPVSDEQLSIISQQHLYPMLNDGHDGFYLQIRN